MQLFQNVFYNILLIIFWGTIIILVFYMMISTKKRIKSTRTPLEMLNERFQNGEVTKDEYEIIKNKLMADFKDE